MTPEKKGECICAQCPSRTDCKEDLGYCFHGKSACIKAEK